jgi:hypothetical protein
MHGRQKSLHFLGALQFPTRFFFADLLDLSKLRVTTQIQILHGAR